MNENERHLKEILVALNKSGILSDLIIIGSWSLLFYKKIFTDFKPLIRTTDLDFYVPNAKAVKEKSGVIESLRSLNYDIVQDTLTNKSRFISYDGFELEFLTRLSRSGLSCIKIGNTGIFAEVLSYVDIFSGNFVEVDFDGLMVKVASPASFVLQKLLINSDRKDKQEKDIESVKYVLAFINLSNKSKQELFSLFETLPKKWQKKIQATIKKWGIAI